MYIWSDFRNIQEGYARNWKLLKEESDDDMRDFLNRAYLVIVYGEYREDMSFNKGDARAVVTDNPGFFVKDKYSAAFLEMGAKARVYRDKKADPPEGFYDKFAGFDSGPIGIVPFVVEVRFPTVRIEAIQRVKNSQYCDRTLTDMSRASIRVVLKAGEAKD
jgi:hypothetical protein